MLADHFAILLFIIRLRYLELFHYLIFDRAGSNCQILPELIHYKKQIDEPETDNRTSTRKIPSAPKLEFWTKTYQE